MSVRAATRSYRERLLDSDRGRGTEVTSTAAADAGGLLATGVAKRFTLEHGEVEALANIDLATPAGSFTALLGPSGCGKSTLLRLFAGLETPSAGEISLHGRTAEAMRREHRIGVAFQDAALLPWRTAEANIAIPFEVAGRKPDRQAIRDLIEPRRARRLRAGAPEPAFRGACASASRSHARSQSIPTSCSSTSPSARSTR